MNTLEDSEMAGINGGFVWIPLMGVYMAFLDKVEKNPESYTWMMDWYYESN